MAYDLKWLRLNEAIRLVVDATGCSKEEAQADICQAVADGEVKIRAQPKRRANTGNTSTATLEGSALEIPDNVQPKDFDWEQSRPRKEWFVKRGGDHQHGRWELNWINLSRTDVTRVFCAGGAQRAAGPATTMSKVSKVRSSPSFDRAKSVIDDLFPGKLPDRANLPNMQLIKQVGQQLKERGLADVSDDSILRAAGRRSK